jgi:hypothetical protein
MMEGNAMKAKGTKPTKSISEKAANVVIVTMVILGTVFFVNLPGASQGEGLATKLFFGFLGAIITIQIIPAVVLVAAMLKGLAATVRGVKPVTVSASDTKK